MSTRLDEVIDYLVATFTTASGVQTFDGPTPTSAQLTDWIVVGSDGEDGGEAATVDQSVSSLSGDGWVDESGEITCSAWSFSGATDVAARRKRAIELRELCEAALNADPTLGGLLYAGRAYAAPSRLQLTQRQTSGGALARVVFTVTYSTTITT